MSQKKAFNAQEIRKVLLVGYNGANNTGAEARLIIIIEEVRKVLGRDIEITVPAICGENLRRYVREDPKLKIVELPTVFFSTLHRLVKEHDLILLTEGSCYMDTWSTYLLLAWLLVTWCAARNGKYVVAYAVDSGNLSGLNKKLVRWVASKTDLIITRTQAAADCLKALEVSAPIRVTADSAFAYDPEADDRDFLKRVWPEASSGVIGIAAIDFYLWPVIFRIWGKNSRCYRWPLYYSDSRKRREARETLAKGYARFADEMIEKHGQKLAFICMEELDEPFARLIQSLMHNARETRIFSSREYNASQITAILRSLGLLVTSRYHAGVLSLAASIPQIAIGHDQRLRNLYRDLEIYDKFFIDHNSPQLFQMLEGLVEYLLRNPLSQRDAINKNIKMQHFKAKQNVELLERLIKREAIP